MTNSRLVRNSLSLFNLVAIMASSIFAFSPSDAACNVSFPIPQELAQNSTFHAQLCGLSGNPTPLPCPAPDAPIKRPGSTADAQSLELQAEVGGLGLIQNAVAVWWSAGYTDSSGFFVELWQHRSVQGIDASGLPAGTIVKFGAPGLAVHADHRFRVAFEQADVKKTCWSGLSDPSIPTVAFPTVGPALPASMYTKVFDDFRRPATSGSATGDGIGPAKVYSTTETIAPANTVKIDSTGQFLEAQQGSGILYSRLKETGASTFAEVLVRVDRDENDDGTDDGNNAFNLAVQARLQGDVASLTANSYAVKVAHVLRGCTIPALIVHRIPTEGNAGCADTNGDGTSDTITPEGVFCDNLPLKSADGTTLYSKPAWVRIEIRNISGGLSEIIGTAYWETGPGTFSSCTHTRTETPPAAIDGDPPGRWGVAFHEKSYQVDVFRAGDGTP